MVGAGEPHEVMERREATRPEPGTGQVRVRVLAAGLGLPDVLMCRGTYPLTPSVPFTPGQEVVGEVTAVGPDTTLAIGDRVMGVSMFHAGHGGFAEECLLAGAGAQPVPVGLPDAQAAGFWIPHHTAWIGLVERGGLRAGETLAVLGAAGGSGAAAVLLGRALGARVLAVAGGADRAAFCLDLGADEVIDHRATPIEDGLRAAAGPAGVDVIYDPVGGEPAETAARVLGRGGRHLAVGFAAGRWPRLRTHELVTANTSLVGVFAGGHSRAELTQIHHELEQRLVDGRLRAAPTEAVGFDMIPTALQRLADRAVAGKLVALARPPIG